MYKKKILIDLDGVLNEHGKEPYRDDFIPQIKEGAINFIRELSKCGELYLFISRNLKLSAKWLYDNDIDKYFKDVTNIKMTSYLYIDDRCICFRGDYGSTLEEIKNFQVYWKNS